jgi:hypothetical protein
MSGDLFLIKRVDQELVRIGFKNLFAHHKQDIQHLIRSYRVTSAVSADEKEWMEKYLYGILSGNKNPKIFLNILKDKLREIELQRN